MKLKFEVWVECVSDDMIDNIVKQVSINENIDLQNVDKLDCICTKIQETIKNTIDSSLPGVETFVYPVD